MSIKMLPQALRPREKLLQQGARALADAELLALFLRTGHGGRDVLQYAQHLLDTAGGLPGLLQRSPAAMDGLPGVGPARRAELAAVHELARRSLDQGLQRQPVFETPQQVRQFLQLELATQNQEVFMVLFLDARHALLTAEAMFRGTLTQTSVYPREVVRRALELHAAAVVLAHNHPSGCLEPSTADTHLTRALQQALALVDVRLLDHFIVTQTGVTSLAERGLT